MEHEQHEEGVAIVDEGRVVVTCECGWVSRRCATGQAAGASFDEHRLRVTTSV